MSVPPPRPPRRNQSTISSPPTNLNSYNMKAKQIPRGNNNLRKPQPTIRGRIKPSIPTTRGQSNIHNRGHFNIRGNNNVPQRAQMERVLMPTMVAMPSSEESIKNARKQAALEAVQREKQLKQRQTITPSIDTDPPCNLHIYIPDHTENCKIEVYKSMTVDELLDSIFILLENKIELKGSRENIEKEFYGLYIPSINTWCRSYKNVLEYDLYKINGEPPMVELRLFSKIKEEEEDNFKDKTSFSSHKKLKQSLAKSKIPAYINNRKRIQIELVEYRMKFLVECDQATSVIDILEFLSEAKPDLKSEIMDFEIYAHVKLPPNCEDALNGKLSERTLLRKHHSLSDCKYLRIQHLEVVRASQTLTIKLKSGKEIQQKTHPDRTIDEILLKSKATAGMTGNNYNLVLLPSKGAELILENNRTLRSYRIGPNDIVLLASKDRNKGSKLKEDKMIFLKIHCPQFNCNRTLKFKLSASVGEVIYRFSKKVSEMNDIALYGLYPSSGSYLQFNVKDILKDLTMPNMAQLVVKLHGGPPNEIYKEKQIFGVDICKMNLVQADSEQDLKVPDILEELKRGLFDAKGMDAQDIFKKKGNKLKEKQIAEELQAEIFPDDINKYDPHDIANEWFARLPVPILSKIDDDDLSMCAIDEEECHYLASKLMEPYKSVFLWMLELMFEVTKNSKLNNMDIKRISACFAPHMLHKPGDYMRKALQDQSTGSILITILEGMGSDWGNNIHGGTMKKGIGYSSVGTIEENKFLRHHLI